MEVAELADMMEGLGTLWPSVPPQAALPSPYLLDTLHQLLAFRCCFCVELYRGVALEARKVMRIRREEDPDIIDLEETSAKYPAAINRRRIMVGVVGGGCVGRAVLQELLRSGRIEPQDIMVSTRQPDRLQDISSRGVFVGFNNAKIAQLCDVVFLCCPMSAAPTVAGEMSPKLSGSTLIVSVMSGSTLPKLKQLMKTESCTTISVNVQSVVESLAANPDVVEFDHEAFLRLVTPNLREFQSELALHSLLSHPQDIDGLSLGIVEATLAHNVAAPEIEASRVVGETVEVQRETAIRKCQSLFESHWEHDPLPPGSPADAEAPRNVESTWRSLMQSNIKKL